MVRLEKAVLLKPFLVCPDLVAYCSLEMLQSRHGMSSQQVMDEMLPGGSASQPCP